MSPGLSAGLATHTPRGAARDGLGNTATRQHTAPVNDTSDREPDPLLHWVAQYASDYRAALSERAVGARVAGASIDAELEPLRNLPEQGLSPEDTIAELVRIAEPGLTAMSGPRFFGWVIGGTLPAALAADWLTATWDQNAGTGEGAPAAVAFENAAIAWIVQLLGLPANTVGGLVSGAMAANFTCLAAARGHLLEAAGWDVQQRGLFGAPNLQILVGHERHETIDKAVRLLGLGKQAIRCTEVDSQGRLRPSSLERELKRCEGPVLVCAQAGNVNSGAFDPLPAINTAVDAYRDKRGKDSIWLHVDGAFGLWARASSATTALAAGVEHADSWATDAHKTLNVPYESGIALCRHLRSLRRAMEISGAYLESGQERTVSNPGLLVPELSRRARGFALWAALRQLGRQGVDALVARCSANARTFARAFDGHASLEVVNEVCFNQVVVLAHPPEGSTESAWTTQLVKALQAEGTCYATPSVWRGKPVVRFSFVNADTTENDVVRSAQALIRVTQGLLP